jgi:uncharacterized alkaline shock family protein YloU
MEGQGHASISPEVIARYASDAALEVEGVHRLVEGHLPRHRGVRIATADDGALTLELHVALEWGVAFADVGRAVQEGVAGYLGRMADLRLPRVDVVVDEIGPVRA